MKNKKLYWIIGIIILLVVVIKVQPKEKNLEFTASYYNKDGNLIGTSGTSKGLSSAQALYSPDITIIPAGTYTIQLAATITNTGTISFYWGVTDIIFNAVHYTSIPGNGDLEVGEQETFVTKLIDISSVYGNQEVIIFITTSAPNHPAYSEVYFWRCYIQSSQTPA